jgi:1-acyl-sn-glycerol-3-phosphate acyltransferase
MEKKIKFIRQIIAVIIMLIVTTLTIGIILILLPLNLFTSLHTDLAQRYWSQLTLIVFGIKVHVEDMRENKQEDEIKHMIMFNHASNIDPLLLVGYLPFNVKFIGKREFFFAPIVGQLAFVFGHIPINRKNLESAIKSLKMGAKRMKKGIVLGISPEGKRSRDGALQSFKKGPFHLALQTQSKITPIKISGAYEVWKPSTWFPINGQVNIKIQETIITNDKMEIEGVSQQVRDALICNEIAN